MFHPFAARPPSVALRESRSDLFHHIGKRRPLFKVFAAAGAVSRPAIDHAHVNSRYSRARSTCAGRAPSGRAANPSPASRLSAAPPMTMTRAETGSNT